MLFVSGDLGGHIFAEEVGGEAFVHVARGFNLAAMPVGADGQHALCAFVTEGEVVGSGAAIAEAEDVVGVEAEGVDEVFGIGGDLRVGEGDAAACGLAVAACVVFDDAVVWVQARQERGEVVRRCAQSAVKEEERRGVGFAVVAVMEDGVVVGVGGHGFFLGGLGFAQARGEGGKGGSSKQGAAAGFHAQSATQATQRVGGVNAVHVLQVAFFVGELVNEAEPVGKEGFGGVAPGHVHFFE